jgi:hypothetical protein
MRTATTLRLLVVLSSLFFSEKTFSQLKKSPFKAGVWLGTNLSQVDGDDQFGYDYWSFSGGLRGGAVLNRRWELATELGYSERGARPETKVIPAGINIRMQYAEVPLMVRYHFYKDDVQHIRLDLVGGLTYSRLLRSSTTAFKNFVQNDTAIIGRVLRKGYNRDEFGLVAGAHWYITPKIGVQARYNFSFSKFYDDPLSDVEIRDNQPNRIDFLRNYWLSFGVFYELNTPADQRPKKVKKKKEQPKVGL